MGRLAAGMARGLLAAALLLPPGVSSAAQSTQYTYDALGRVLSAIDGSGRKVVYSYDGAGNRTRVSNGAEFQEIVPTAWSASSNAGTTGLATANAMQDGDFSTLASIHATNTQTNAWIAADLGSAKTVNHIDVAPAIATAVAAAPEDLNGTVVEYSLDGTKWSAAATINGVSPGATRTVALGGISARHVRIRRAISGQVAIGDLRLFSAAVANSPLIAQPDSITTASAAVTFDPRTNDQDLDGYAFTISSVEDPPHGTAVVNAGVSITYTPDPGYFGADSFLYSVADGHNGTASARVTALVRPSTNHAPVAVADSFIVSDRVTAVVDGLNSLRPSANDYDADGDVITITAKTDPAHGTVTIVGGNVIEYQPTVSYTGTDSFSYTISDGRGDPSTATVTLTLANASPVAGSDTVSVQRNTSVTFDPRLNDRDPNGDAITVSAISGSPAQGTATLNPDQTVTYGPYAGVSGADVLTYTLTDARGATATGRVTFAISGNTVPEARHDSLAASGSAVSLDPRANDADADGDPLTITAITQPAHGSATLNSGGASVTYTPAAGYTADDSFTYTVSDDEGGSATATIAINAIAIEYLVVGGGGGGGGSGYPTGGGGGGGGGARQGTLVLPASTALTATVGAGGGPGGSGNASALGAISASGGGRGGNGGAGVAGGSGGGGSGAAGGSGSSGEGNAGGQGSSLTAGGGGGAGGAGGAGTHSCVEYVCNGGAGYGGPGLDSAIGGALTNYAAGGGGGGYSHWIASNANHTAYGHQSSGSSGGYGQYSWGYMIDAPAGRGGGGGGGGFTIDEEDTYSAAPAGAGGSGVVIVRYFGAPRATGGTIAQVGGYTIHTFTAAGTFTSPTANSPPVAVNDTILAVSGAARVFDPRTNDTDPNGDPMTVTSAGPAAHGVVTLNPAGHPVTYTPTTGYTGPDSFTYVVSDGQASATATVNVTVSAGAAIEYLVVAGGGGGGRDSSWGPYGAGGGGGGVRTGFMWLPAGAYAVTVGAGGVGAVGGTPAANGAPSAIGGVAALGGGAGGTGGPGASGGSGGGGTGHNNVALSAGGAGTPGQGHPGGSIRFSPTAAGGGGAGGPGEGAAGSNIQGGAGGPGLSSAIDGTSRTYGSGGRGGGGSAGAANRGEGGAGSSPGASGGSGIVILRYPTGTFSGTGGTVTTSGGYTIHAFTSNGTFTLP